MLGLLPSPPAKVEGGSVTFDDQNLLHLPIPILRAIRGKRISMIFQDPMSCLNPYLPILEQVVEPILTHEQTSREEAESRAIEMMIKVGIRDAETRARSYPHQFSGGMRQRAMIAMALVTNPDLLLADEPTTAPDVTVQARILQILRELRNDLGVAVLFVTHDLGVVADAADRVVVMYRGKVVEQGSVLSIFENPSHPYVKGLLACRPTFETKYRILPTVEDFLHAEEAKDGSLTLRERPNAMERFSNLENKHDPKDFRREPEQPLLLEVKDLECVHFTSGSGFEETCQTVKAVDGVDLSIAKGKTLGLVGESGCGKTTLGRAILGLVHARSGIVRYDAYRTPSVGYAILPKADADHLSGSLRFPKPTPYHRTFSPEPLTVHQIGSGSSDRRERVVSLLEEVGLSSAHFFVIRTNFPADNANAFACQSPRRGT